MSRRARLEMNTHAPIALRKHLNAISSGALRLITTRPFNGTGHAKSCVRLRSTIAIMQRRKRRSPTNRFLKNAFSQVNRGLSGTLYVGSTISEPSPSYVLSGKLKRFSSAIPRSIDASYITTQSLASVGIPENSIDYVFIDPPFGDNLPY